jgi:hypothetical protein
MCIRCINTKDREGEGDEVQIWSALATFDDVAKLLFFKNKENATAYILNELKNIFEDKNSYDHDGNPRTADLNVGLRAQKIRTNLNAFNI